MKQTLEEALDINGETLEFPEEKSLWYYRMKVLGKDIGESARAAASVGYRAAAAVVKTALRVPLYCIAGNLPGDAQRTLEQRLGKDWFNAVNATRWSLAANIPLQAYAVYLLATQADRLESTPLAFATSGLAAYAFLEFIYRGAASSEPGAQPAGSVSGVLLYKSLRLPAAVARAMKGWWGRLDERARSMSQEKGDLS